MNNTFVKNTTSFVLILVMVMNIFGFTTVFDTDSVSATTSDKNVSATSTAPAIANPLNNTIVIPAKMIRGTLYGIPVKGDRYEDIIEKYNKFIANTTDKSIFIQGEEFFEPVKITVKSSKVSGAKVNREYNYALSPYSFSRLEYGVNLKFNAGKYTITSQFKKRAVDISDPVQKVPEFVDKDAQIYTVTETFYVKAKVKFAYSKRYGKLSKKQRTKYLDPGKKFGKLPKPKAKKGYKFKGWYSKAKGGKKIKSTSKVPTQNDVILYARYVRK